MCAPTPKIRRRRTKPVYVSDILENYNESYGSAPTNAPINHDALALRVYLYPPDFSHVYCFSFRQRRISI